MLYCKQCKMNVTGAPERCPLCHGELSGTPDPEGGAFVPLEDIKSELDLLFRLVTMAAICVVVISVAVDYLIDGALKWSLFVSGGALCGWLFAVVGWRKRRELAKNIFMQVTIVSVASVIWDLATGWRGWSLDYGIPCACVAAILALSALVIILRLESSDYIVYLLTVALYGLAPLVFLLTGVVDVRYPSVICSTLCALMIIGLLLFFRKNTVDELKKKLHM